jgi:hypothetical protein
MKGNQMNSYFDLESKLALGNKEEYLLEVLPSGNVVTKKGNLLGSIQYSSNPAFIFVFCPVPEGFWTLEEIKYILEWGGYQYQETCLWYVNNFYKECLKKRKKENQCKKSLLDVLPDGTVITKYQPILKIGQIFRISSPFVSYIFTPNIEIKLTYEEIEKLFNNKIFYTQEQCLFFVEDFYESKLRQCRLFKTSPPIQSEKKESHKTSFYFKKMSNKFSNDRKSYKVYSRHPEQFVGEIHKYNNKYQFFRYNNNWINPNFPKQSGQTLTQNEIELLITEFNTLYDCMKNAENIYNNHFNVKPSPFDENSDKESKSNLPNISINNIPDNMKSVKIVREVTVDGKSIGFILEIEKEVSYNSYMKFYMFCQLKDWKTELYTLLQKSNIKKFLNYNDCIEYVKELFSHQN